MTKLNPALSLAVVLMASLSQGASALADQPGQDLSGSYEVVSSGCAQFSFYVGQKDVLLQADATGMRLGAIYYTGNGGPGSQPYFQAAFAFQTGTTRQNCMGDCYAQYDSSYSADGYEFKAVRSFAFTMSAQPVYAGETDFTLAGDTLTVNTTDDGQGQPGALATCVLKKSAAR